MKLTLVATIGAIGLLTASPGDCSVEPPPTGVPEGRLYMVDGNGEEWPVVAGEPGSHIYFYMAEFDWTVKVDLIQPEDPRYERPWQYSRIRPASPGVVSGFYVEPDCQGEARWAVFAEECVDGYQNTRPDPSSLPWQPVSPFAVFATGGVTAEMDGVAVAATSVESIGPVSFDPGADEVEGCTNTPGLDLSPGVLCGIRSIQPEHDWEGVPPEPYVLKFDRL